jgi:nucleotide-binding universal stress UspA family protein
MNILLPVSRGPSFADAIRLAADTAMAHDGRVRVLAVVDQGEIRRIERGAHPGAIHLARHAAAEVEKRMVAEGTAAVREATRFCEAAGVPVQGEVREGELEKELSAAAGGCDLLVSAAASHFAPDMEDLPGRFVLSLMKDGAIPVLLAGAPPRPVRTVVVGCGGGPRSERVTGAMARLSLWKSGCRMILLAVDDSPGGGQARLSAPRQVLSDAGYPAWEERVVSGPRLESFSSFCEAEGADVVALGGWGERRWDDLLGRSITGRLLEEGRRHLFLYM